MNGINWKIYLNPAAEYKWYANKIVYYPVCLILIFPNTYICPIIDILLDSHFYCGWIFVTSYKNTSNYLNYNMSAFVTVRKYTWDKCNPL